MLKKPGPRFFSRVGSTVISEARKTYLPTTFVSTLPRKKRTYLPPPKKSARNKQVEKKVHFLVTNLKKKEDQNRRGIGGKPLNLRISPEGYGGTARAP